MLRRPIIKLYLTRGAEYYGPDILNIAQMRPIYSPSDFVLFKGRGTRKHNILEQLFDEALRPLVN